MKLKNVEDQQKLKRYCEFLIQLGDGDLLTDETGAVRIPDEFLLPSNDPDEALKWVYDDKPPPLPERPEEPDR